MRVALAALALMALLGGPAHTNEISGHVRVIDGDTIVILDTNTHIRLNGVDAPEVVHPGYHHDDDFGPEFARGDAPDRRRRDRPLRTERGEVVRAVGRRVLPA